MEAAEAILAAHPEVRDSGVHVAAILGDADALRRSLPADPRRATARDGPYDWDALMHLCFSRNHRVRPSPRFV
ncbi:MAG: hypothetical protein ACJ8H8_32595 [Geminicoccaceae bacterium]